jgi:hypothetical protein
MERQDRLLPARDSWFRAAETERRIKGSSAD